MKSFVVSFLVSIVVFSAGFYAVDKLVLSPSSYADSIDLVERVKKDEEDKTVDSNKDKDEIQFVLMGIDDGGLKPKRGVRTDTIILMSANFENGDIKALTVPRDSRVDVKGKKDKLNHAHSYGGKELAMTTINDYLGTDMKYYVRVDFEGVMKIVDAIGGVDMTVPVNMKYDDPTAKPQLHINLKKGEQTLSGKQSHDLLRFRHNNGTDYYPHGYTREEVQQMWLKEFIRSALKPKNIIKLPKMIETYFDSVDTNIPIKDMISYALKANKLNVDSIDFRSTPPEDESKPGYIIGDTWYFIPNEEESRKIADELFMGESM